MNNAFVEGGGEGSALQIYFPLRPALNLLAEIKSGLGRGSYMVSVLSGSALRSWADHCGSTRHEMLLVLTGLFGFLFVCFRVGGCLPPSTGHLATGYWGGMCPAC